MILLYAYLTGLVVPLKGNVLEAGGVSMNASAVGGTFCAMVLFVSLNLHVVVVGGASLMLLD
jgi:hypothetical protein